MGITRDLAPRIPINTLSATMRDKRALDARPSIMKSSWSPSSSSRRNVPIRSTAEPKRGANLCLVLTSLFAYFAMGQSTLSSTSFDAAFTSHIVTGRAADNTPGAVGTGTEKSLGSNANVVDLSICLASLVGCLIIIIPYLLNKRSRKLRHSLIVGLATSDLCSAVTIITSTSFLLDGGNLVDAHRFCTFLGLTLTTTTYTQHFWNLCILCITYMILMHPLSRFTMTIERRVLWLWPIIWLVSLGINGFAWGSAGFSYAGGYCYLGSKFGSLFTSLFPLVPRVCVVLVILVLYTRLFFFLRRTNFFEQSETMSGSALTASGFTVLRNADAICHQHGHAVGDLDGRSGQAGSLATKLHVPLLRMSAATASGRGSRSSSSQGPSATSKHKELSSASSSIMPIKMKDYTIVLSAPCSPRTANTTVSPTGVSTSSRRSDTHAWPAQGIAPGEPPAPSLMTTESLVVSQLRRSRSLPDLNLGSQMSRTEDRLSSDVSSDKFDQSGGLPNAQETASNVGSALRSDGSGLRRTKSQKRSLENERSRNNRPIGSEDADEDDDSVPDFNIWAGLSRMKPRRDTQDFHMVTAPREHLRHFNVRANSLSEPSRSSIVTARQMILEALCRHQVEGQSQQDLLQETLSRRGSGSGTGLTDQVTISMPGTQQTRQAAAYENFMGDDWRWGINVTAAAKGTQIKRGKSGSVISLKGERDVSATREGNADDRHMGSLATSGFDECGVENVGSTLNRQASALLLLYPFAYLVLFALSLVRLIRDAASGHRHSDLLANVSRWLIFAQGALDCIIFQVIERQFRRRMKRKRAKAIGEDGVQSSSTRFWLWSKRRASRFVERRR